MRRRTCCARLCGRSRTSARRCALSNPGVFSMCRRMELSMSIVRHRRVGVCPLWRPPTADRHAARSRGHPEDPRAPRPRPLGAESRPRPSRVRRRRVLIGSARGRGGRRRVGAARCRSPRQGTARAISGCHPGPTPCLGFSIVSTPIWESARILGIWLASSR
jgi:hypothetical protein